MDQTDILLPNYVPYTLLACLLIAMAFGFFSSSKKVLNLIIIMIWCGGLALIGLSGLLDSKNSIAPWVVFFTPIVLLSVATIIPGARNYMRGIKDEQLHHLHLWRVPFAFVLLWFYQAQITPLGLTFEGYNYDIIIGLTAPVIGSLAFSQKMLTKEIVLGWNGLGIVFLLISTGLIFMELTINQKALLLFNDLPYFAIFGFLLPLSLFSHVLSIYRILKGHVTVSD